MANFLENYFQKLIKLPLLFHSVTEEEIRRGVITAPDVEKHCLWFKRTITNLRQHTDKPKAGSFIDKTWGNPPSIDEEAQKLLTHFREEEIPQVLPETNIKKVRADCSHGFDAVVIVLLVVVFAIKLFVGCYCW